MKRKRLWRELLAWLVIKTVGLYFLWDCFFHPSSRLHPEAATIAQHLLR